MPPRNGTGFKKNGPSDCFNFLLLELRITDHYVTGSWRQFSERYIHINMMALTWTFKILPKLFIHSPFQDVGTVLIFNQRCWKIKLWSRTRFFCGWALPCSPWQDLPYQLQRLYLYRSILMGTSYLSPSSYAIQYFPSSCYQVINLQKCHSKPWGNYVCIIPSLFADVCLAVHDT